MSKPLEAWDQERDDSQPTFDIDAAQQLCDNATEGPWEKVGSHVEEEAGNYSDITPTQVQCMAYCYGGSVEPMRESDAAFIAAARTLLPDALDEIRRLRAQVQRVEALLPKWQEDRAGYPLDDIHASYAFIAVKLCSEELAAALGEPS